MPELPEIGVPGPLAVHVAGFRCALAGLGYSPRTVGNRYILAGAQYNPQVLAGLSAAQIASQLRNPSSPVARAIDGSAKVIIAAINRVLQEEAARG